MKSTANKKSEQVIEIEPGIFAEVQPGKSIRLFGHHINQHGKFKAGEWIETKKRFSNTYTVGGPAYVWSAWPGHPQAAVIESITAKTVLVRPYERRSGKWAPGEETKRLSLLNFFHPNRSKIRSIDATCQYLSTIMDYD